MHGRHDQLHGSLASAHGLGHNQEGQETAQWQTPHMPHAHHHVAEATDEHRDLDLVEQAFIQGFAATSDPTSFLRLAGIPFEGTRSDGSSIRLLRVEQSQATDVASITPHLGGGTFHYNPLPAKLVSRRDQLKFIYFDGTQMVNLSLEEAKALEPFDGSNFAPGGMSA